MTAASAILWTAAAFMFGYGPAYYLALHVRERREDRADARRREEQDRAVDREWLALLAATETTPIYDALKCEEIERAEGWVR